MSNSRIGRFLASLMVAGCVLSAPSVGEAQVTGRVTANNGYAFGFGSATAVTTRSSGWVWNGLACDIACCTGWETYSIPAATLSSNEYAYILAAGDNDSLTGMTATFLDSAGGVVLNTNTTGGEWQACDMGAQSGSTEPTGGWDTYVNGRIGACTWVNLVAGWNGGNACMWAPTPTWVWGSGIATANRRVLFRTRTTEITPPACVDSSVTGMDTGCTSTLPYCLGAGPTARCVACTTAAHCDDRNPCTIDACAENACLYASVAGGLVGGCATGFVCSGGLRNRCVDCIDDAATTLDSGCGRGVPHCRTTGTGAPVCEVCIDSIAGAGTDLGCAAATPNCVVGRDGAWLCVSCTSAADCGDGNECTTDSCVGGSCRHASVSAGGLCTGGVCDGAVSNPLCAPCLDNQAGGMMDTGCSAALPLCLPTIDSFSCQACDDTEVGMVDPGCRDTTPACVTVEGANVCVPCEDTAEGSMQDDGCAASAPLCVPGAGGVPGCVACTIDADCSGALPFCDSATNTCVACTASASCPLADPVCSPETDTCGPCMADTDCAMLTATPVCDEASGDCVAVMEVDAGPGEVDAGAEDAGAEDAGADDAGPIAVPDAGIDGGPEPGALTGGACGCSVHTNRDAGGLLASLLVFGLAWARRRRSA